MLNMVTNEDLKDREELDDITNDIRTECSSYGTVLEVVIPGFMDETNTKLMPGGGKVWANFATVEEAKKCKKNLNGRSFADRTVVATFYDTEKFLQRNFE